VAILPVLWSATPALAQVAQDQVEAPSEYLDAIETQGALGGEEDEVDAGAAQVEAEQAGRKDGLSRGAGRRVEEIVVSARKRTEFLEDTPLAVTALGEDALRESTIVRLDGIQQLVPNLMFSSNASGSTNIQIRAWAPAIARSRSTRESASTSTPSSFRARSDC
jgi:outer membrane receptor protein involved in Fe transport